MSRRKSVSVPMRTPLSSRGAELVEQARRERNEKVLAATREFHNALGRANHDFRTKKLAATREMNDRITAIECSDRSGILLGHRIEEVEG